MEYPWDVRLDELQDSQGGRIPLAAVALLQRQTDHFRMALDRGRVGMWVWDVDRGEVYLDTGLKELLGYKADEVQYWAELVHPEDLEDLRHQADAYIAGESPVMEVENRLRHKEGHYLVFMARGDLTVDPQGGRWVIGMAIDVTERKSLEDSLRHSHEDLEARVAVRTAELRLTNERLNLTLDNLNLIAYEVDTAGIWTLSRGKGLEKLGRRPDESVGLSHFDHYSDKPEIVEAMRRALAGQSQEVENEVGGRIWHSTYNPLVGPSGKIERVYGTAVDITEHRQAHLRLQQESAEHESARRRLTGFNQVLRLVAGETPLSEVLEGLVRTVEDDGEGLSVAIMLADRSRRCLRLVAAPSLPAEFNQLIDDTPIGQGCGSCGQAAFSGERVIVDDIATHPYWQNARQAAATAGLRACWSEPILSSSSEVLGTFTLYYRRHRLPSEAEHELVQGATSLAAIAVERRRSDEAARVTLSLQRLRNEILKMKDEYSWEEVNRSFYRELSRLIDFNECAIALVDLNQNRYTVYCTGPERVLGQSFWQVPDSLRQTMENKTSLMRGDRDSIQTHGDDIVPEVAAVVDVPFDAGTISINTKDGAKLGEEHVHVLEQFAPVMSEAYHRLEELRALESRRMQLQQAQKMEAVGQLTAGVAHNFNNLLQGIITQLYLHQDEENTARPWMQPTLDTAMRAADLIAQLMQFSRLGQEVAPEPVDLTGVIGRVLEIVQKIFDRRIDIRHRFEVGDAYVTGDGTQLEQVFLNMLLNARDALQEVGRGDPSIRVDLDRVTCGTDIPAEFARSRPGDYWRVRIVDNGIGMDDNTRRRVFEPFFTTKDATRGTGLGLATSYGTVCDHRGWLECDSTGGGGAVFSVYLPANESERGTQESGAASVHAEVSGEGCRLLLIEDEDVVREGLVDYLSLQGYSVVSAADGIEGLECLGREKIDLVLLDLSMPKMSGEEVLERLARLPEKTPTVVFSGYATDITTRFSVEAVLIKPIVPNELVATLRRVLRPD
jgi:PAS domain S-box-containing protein